MDLDNLDNLPVHEAMLSPKNRRVKKSKAGKRKLVEKNEHKASNVENDVAYYLCKKGVEFNTEKTFPDLCSILFPEKLLPLDFFLPKLKGVIEVDGVHHRKKVKSDRFDYSLDRRILNDQTRNLFCIKRGFKILRINDRQFKDFRRLIDEFIDELSK